MVAPPTRVHVSLPLNVPGDGNLVDCEASPTKKKSSPLPPASGAYFCTPQKKYVMSFFHTSNSGALRWGGAGVVGQATKVALQ